MDERIKKLWIERLRKNVDKQGKRCLAPLQQGKDTGKRCCLGVLCDIYIEENKTHWAKLSSLRLSLLGCDSYLPFQVRLWAGLLELSPTVILKTTINGKEFRTSLATLNDGFMMNIDGIDQKVEFNFNRIADIIEREL